MNMRRDRRASKLEKPNLPARLCWGAIGGAVVGAIFAAVSGASFAWVVPIVAVLGGIMTMLMGRWALELLNILPWV